MRIERVVADTFSEASERARQRFGRDALVLSTNKVGNVTELLVCIDMEAEAQNDSSAPGAAVVGDGFRAALDGVIAGKDAVSVTAAAPQSPSVATPVAAKRVDPEDGLQLVAAIRAELHALEKRLSAGQVQGGLTSGMLALLEQGVAASYARKLLAEDVEIAAMASGMLADLVTCDLGAVLGVDGLAVVGPAGSGKTTLVMQVARAVAERSPCSVSALRDARPGARERFFALADRATLEASWGGVPEGISVFDTGAMDVEELQRACKALETRGMILCLPAHMQRVAALRWLNAGLPIAAVVITHWESCEQPLGLLSLLAERGVPLCGLSATADATAALTPIDRARLETDLARILELTLCETDRSVG